METGQQMSDRKRAYWKRARICNYVGIVLGICLAGPFFYMLLDRREPITLYEGRFDPDVVRPDQKVNVIWYAKENRPCDGEIERRIVDSSKKIHAFTRESTVYHIQNVNGIQLFTKPIIIPDSIAQGEAIYSTHGHRWCNPVQKYIWPIEFFGPAVKFYVVKSRPEP